MPHSGGVLEAAVATRGLKLGTLVEPQAHGAPLAQDGVGGAGQGAGREAEGACGGGACGGGDAGACLEGRGQGTASAARRSLGPRGVRFLGLGVGGGLPSAGRRDGAEGR